MFFQESTVRRFQKQFRQYTRTIIHLIKKMKISFFVVIVNKLLIRYTVLSVLSVLVLPQSAGIKPSR